MKKVLYIIGKGEHGKLVSETAQLTKDYIEIRFIDDGQNKIISGSTVDFDSLNQSSDEKRVIFIAVGNNHARRKLYKKVRRFKIPIVSIIHPTAFIAKSVTIGDNVYIGPKTIINSQTTVKTGTIVNTGCIVEHDNKIGEFAHLSPGVITGGGVIIGNSTFIGLGSIINDHLELADNIIVGSGSVVTKSFKLPKKTIIGIPAHEKV